MATNIRPTATGDSEKQVNTIVYSEADYTSELEQLIKKVGNNGKFQKGLLFGFLNPLIVALPFAIMATMFMVATPEHNCYVPGRDLTNFTEQEWRNITIPSEVSSTTGILEFSKCSRYDLSLDYWNNETEAYDVQQWLEDKNGSTGNTTSCSYGWDYDTTWYKRTISSQENWVCGMDYVPSTVLSIAEFGTVAGALCFGHLADRLGRKVMFLITTLIRTVFRVMALLSVNVIPLFFLSNFLSATSMPVIYQAPYTLCIEYSAPEQRAFVTTISAVAWVLGLSLLPLFVWAVGDWLIIGIVSVIPLFIFLFFFRYIPESLRWLVSRGKTEEAIKLVQRIARVNELPLPDNYEETLERLSSYSKKEEKTYGFLTLFKYKKLAINTIALVFCWTVSGIGYMVLQLNFGNMAGNPFVNNFLLSLIELPATLLALLLMNSLGRRWTNVLFLLLGSICGFMIVCIITDPNLSWLTTVLILGSKFSVTLSFNTVYLQAAELFPTCLRNTGMSFATMVAASVSIGSPYIVYLGSYDERYPHLILGILGILGGIVGSFLPETLNESLPETVDDAKKFGSTQSYFTFIATKRRSSTMKTKESQKDTVELQKINR